MDTRDEKAMNAHLKYVDDRCFTLPEIQNAIRAEIKREYTSLDEDELQDKIYETIGLVTAALRQGIDFGGLNGKRIKSNI